MNIDETLTKIVDSVLDMGDLVIEQHVEVCNLLEVKDKKKALQILRKDEFVNKKEEEINNQAIAAFALLGPVASDLRSIIVAIKIASELERIGDYAKGLAEFIIENEREYDNLIQYVSVIEQKTTVMLGNAMQAYQNRDVNAAFEIPKHYGNIEELHKEFKSLLVQDKHVDIEYAFYISSLLRNVERTKDHTTNICEEIIYMMKGIHYDFD